MRSPAFRRLWLGTAISELGSNVGRFAFILLVHDLARDEPDPEFSVALVMALETLPMILLGPLAGALVDRLDRRAILVVGDLLSGALLLTLPWLATLESRVPLYAAALVFSTLGTIFHPTRLSAIPDLVERDDLAEANSISTITSSLNLILGTVVVAPLIGFFGRTGTFLIDAAAFLVSAAVLASVSLPRHTIKRDVGRLLHEMLDGLVYLVSRRVLTFLTLVYFMSYAFVGAWWPLLPSFVDDGLALDPDVWAPLVIGSFGGGGLLGGAFAPALGRRLGKGRAYFAAFLGFAVSVQFFAGATHIATCAVVAAFAGAAVFALLVLDTTLVQEETDVQYRGRVFGTREPMRAAGMLFATTLVLTFAASSTPRDLMDGAARLLALALVAAALLPGARALWRRGSSPS